MNYLFSDLSEKELMNLSPSASPIKAGAKGIYLTMNSNDKIKKNSLVLEPLLSKMSFLYELEYDVALKNNKQPQSIFKNETKLSFSTTEALYDYILLQPNTKCKDYYS